MSIELTDKLNAMIAQIDKSSTAERMELATAMEGLIERLDAVGEEVPAETRNRVNEIVEDAVEDAFDNLPL